MSFLGELKELCDNAGINNKAYEHLAERLVAAHSEPHRHYHTVDHIEAVLRHLRTLDAMNITTAFAAFYHDLVYDPTRSDNEEKSALLAAASLTAMRVPQAGDVAAIIRATAAHELTNDLPPDAASFLDADLAILGQRPAIYHAYTLAVRAEYIHMPDADFRAGRAAVLHSFADRPTLFFTAAGHDLWEAQARANIARELEALAI